MRENGAKTAPFCGCKVMGRREELSQSLGLSVDVVTPLLVRTPAVKIFL
jgi:hypothetical protein